MRKMARKPGLDVQKAFQSHLSRDSHSSLPSLCPRKPALMHWLSPCLPALHPKAGQGISLSRGLCNFFLSAESGLLPRAHLLLGQGTVDMKQAIVLL